MSRPEQTPEQSAASKKKKNLGTIFIVVALILIVVLIMTFPGVDEDATLIERLEIIFQIDPGSDGEDDESVIPTPDPAQFSQPQSEEDKAFLALLESFLVEDADAGFDRLMTLHTEYLPQFEAINTKELTDPDLIYAADTMVQLLKDWTASIYVNDKKETEGIDDWQLWSQVRVDLCYLVQEVDAKYNLLPDTKYAVQQYDYILPIWQAQLEVQNDLASQLAKPKKVWSAEEKCYYISYTNNTEFDMDVTIYGDYFTEKHHYFTDNVKAKGLKPGETVTLYMRRMPDDVSDWVADWVVDTYYVDGIDIYDYY